MDWLPVASGFQSRDEVPGRNDGDAFVLMKVEQVTDVAGHEVVRSATNGCRERFVVVGIAAPPAGRLAQNEFSPALHVIESHQNRRAALALRQPATPPWRWGCGSRDISG